MRGLPSTTFNPGIRPLLALSAAMGALLAVSLGIWARYGGTVFLEMVATGFRTCF